ncbi:MAG: 1-hydroxycarotenoid 3,4-desaturase CrtD [Pseudomonadota bacterium]
MRGKARVVVVGAGVGGLAAALRLAHAGFCVDVVEQAAGPGGKMRTIDSDAGPVDAGPTVLTMRPVLEDLFESVDESLASHVALEAEPVLARHFWPDGSKLDLHSDPDRSAHAIRAFAGSRSEQEFRAFCRDADALFAAFDGPVMQRAKPDLMGIARAGLANPGLMAGAPNLSLWWVLSRRFSDPRLAQLFARYATYVGGSPFRSPAVLMLIWAAEAAGVWRVRGGMAMLARALEALARHRGARFHYKSTAQRILCDNGHACGVELQDGSRLAADRVLFNGDPAALRKGFMGEAVVRAVPAGAVAARSLSAYVWAFAARPQGVRLGHHNVFFNRTYRDEFDAIAAGAMPRDATLYICAQDRGAGKTPSGPERFEIIMNAAPVAPGRPEDNKEFETCRTRTFDSLAAMGLTFDPVPERAALTTPGDFARLFPGSQGSLYGLSPHGMTATFRRPTARTAIPGLYLAGGGAHPGAGVPMALTSGRHAAEAITTDHASMSPSRRTAMRGGMSTAFPTTAAVPSRSSGS